MEENELEEFFDPTSPFLTAIADKAAALRNDPDSVLGQPQNIKRLVTLSLYKPVIYCDDSGSMQDPRWTAQAMLVDRIARIATKIVPSNLGVDLQFINGPPSFNVSAEAIRNIIAGRSPGGSTPLGSSLQRKILTPIVEEALARGSFDRPVLVCIITDGVPDSENPTFKQVILNCMQYLGNKGLPITAVKYCISQIGDDPPAARFLRELSQDSQLNDVVFCTTDRLDAEFEKLKEQEGRLEEWLLRLLTAPLMKVGLN